MIPTNMPSTNPFALLADDDDDTPEHVANATTTYALSDSGASGHFLTEHAAVINKQPATAPIAVTLPDGGPL